MVAFMFYWLCWYILYEWLHIRFIGRTGIIFTSSSIYVLLVILVCLLFYWLCWYVFYEGLHVRFICRTGIIFMSGCIYVLGGTWLPTLTFLSHWWLL